MADLPVSPIRLLASLRQLSKQFLVAEEELRIARDAWDDANLSRLEAESSEPMDQQVVDQFTADETRLEAAMMQLSEQFFQMEDTIDSVARDLAFVMPWPSDKISEAIRRLETKIGLKPHNFVDGRTLDDLQEFLGLVLAIDKTDWPELQLLPVWGTHDVMTQPLQEDKKAGPTTTKKELQRTKSEHKELQEACAAKWHAYFKANHNQLLGLNRTDYCREIDWLKEHRPGVLQYLKVSSPTAFKAMIDSRRKDEERYPERINWVDKQVDPKLCPPCPSKNTAASSR